MKVTNRHLEIELAAAGALRGVVFQGKNFICDHGDDTLFRFQLRDSSGAPLRLGSDAFATVETRMERRGGEQFVFLSFSDCPASPAVRATVTLRLPDHESMSYWHIRIETIPAEHYCEWIDFPRLHCRNHLAGHGGEDTFFWPGSEGSLFREFATREASGFAGALLEYPLTGVGGYYPGPCPMQFQALCSPDGSLYMGCHDLTHSPKGIDVTYGPAGEIVPSFQFFTGGDFPAAVELPFELVLGGFTGDWQDACDIYRHWLECRDRALPVKLEHNPEVPAWLTDSPVLLIYPVKGDGADTGSLTGNCYFPYENALPMVDFYHDLWDSRIMALLMHWEGTAPWAPPYVWPPFGGEAMLRDFAGKLHESDNLLGVYCSGTGWTQTSSIDPSYRRDDQFEREQLRNEMCTGPAGEMFARVCNGGPGQGQRIGYELCPAREWTVNTVTGEIAGILRAQVDYLQFFDQNQGCSAPLCYSREHGHPGAPGAWETAAMRALLDAAAATVRSARPPVVLGCENAAAQPYIRNLQLNDLRNHLAWRYAEPVPAYSYLFHEYINNFTGNGVCLALWFDYRKSPWFLLYRTAYSFISGEILSVVMKDNMQMHWSWVCRWDEPPPDQEPLRILIGNLNGWRRQRGRNFLVFGRMEKNFPVQCARQTLYFTAPRSPAELPAVLSSHWSHRDRHAVFVVNASTEEQEFQLDFGRDCHGKYCVDARSGTSDGAFSGRHLNRKLAPLSAVMIEINM